MQNTNQGGFCPKCGKQFTAGAAFCMGCGANLSQLIPPANPVAPQPQPQPQPQYVAPKPQPQPQYAPPQPQYNPAPQYVPQPQYPQQPMYSNTQTVSTVRRRPIWQTISSILLLIAALIILVVPTFNFYRYSYSADDMSDSDVKEYVEEMNEDSDTISILQMMFDDEYSIMTVFDNFSERMDYIDDLREQYNEYVNNSYYYDSYYDDEYEDYLTTLTMNAFLYLIQALIMFVVAIVFFVIALIHGIKAITAMSKGQYAELVRSSVTSLTRIFSVFITFSIYSYGSYEVGDDNVLRSGASMSLASSAVLYLAIALVVAAMLVGVIMNRKKTLCPEKIGGTLKHFVSFLGMMIVAVIMVSQKMQVLFTESYSTFYPTVKWDEDNYVFFLVTWGVLITYAAVTGQVIKNMMTSATEVLYFTHQTQEEIDFGEVKRTHSLNILSSIVFLSIITIALFVFENEYDFFLVNSKAIIAMAVISILTYVGYRILEAVFNPNKKKPQAYAPQSNNYYAPQQPQNGYYVPQQDSYSQYTGTDSI